MARIKQYVTEPAYEGNTGVYTYADGAVESYYIIADYELSGYLLGLQNRGYKECYDLKTEYDQYLEAKKAYEDAALSLSKAQCNHVIGQMLVNGKVVNAIWEEKL